MEQARQISNRAAALLRLCADIDLDEAGRAPASLVDGTGQRRDQQRAIDAVNGIEQRHRILRLVRLQLPHQMQAQPRRFIKQLRPFGLRFLHPVFTEQPVSLGNQRADRGGLTGLADGNQAHILRLAPGNAARGIDAAAHLGERRERGIDGMNFGIGHGQPL